MKNNLEYKNSHKSLTFNQFLRWAETHHLPWLIFCEELMYNKSMNLEEVLQRGILHELSIENQEVVDKIIDKIITSEVLVKKGSNVIIEPMMYNNEEYGTCFTITCLFDEESPYYDVIIELCKDCLIIHYRKKDEKFCTTIHNEKGDFLLHKDFAKKLYEYVEENKDTIFNKAR